MFDPRSLLFVPANRPDRFARAGLTPADALILDLEDSVGVTDKVSSRDNLAQAAQYARSGGRALFVRINPAGTSWHHDDLIAAVDVGARGVVLPKAEDPSVVADTERLLAEVEAGRSALELILIVETAAGVLAVDRLAVPGERTRRLAFGAYDFALDMGVLASEADELMTQARVRVAMAAAAAKVQAIDTVLADIRDEDALRRQTTSARNMGYTGKFVIHPDQVAVVNEIFTPSQKEVDTARRVSAAFRDAENRGIAAITVDDKLVDYPVAQRSEALLARAETFGVVTR